MEIQSEDSRGDDALVALINQGDTGAFEVLYRRHRDWVANLAFRFIGDRDLALDVLQETFLYVLRKFPGFRLTCQFRSFLYPAVKNLSIAARRRSERLQPADDDSLGQIPAPADPETSESERDQMAGALAALPPAQREVVLLRFVDGMSLEEIAKALDIPAGTVKSRLHTALTALREDRRTRTFFTE